MLTKLGFTSPIFAAALIAACSPSSSTPAQDAGADAATCATPGGPVSGAQDAHCGATSQPTSMASCHPDAGATDAAAVDSGMPMGDGGMSMFGETMYNAEGDDDDCKYHVKWTSTPVCESGAGVTFTVTVTKKADGTPLTGAAPYAEVFLSDTHPAPDTGNTTEASGGVYTMGPIRFDAPGKWTVRFHFYGDCADDMPDSPHGHAAFFVSVP